MIPLILPPPAGAMLALALAATTLAGPAPPTDYRHPGALYTAEQFAPEARTRATDRIVAFASSLPPEPPAPRAVFDVPGYSEQPEEQQRRVKELQGQVRAAYVHALAFRLSGEDRHVEPARRILLAWMGTNTRIAGRDGAVVMNYLGVGLLLTADLLWDQLSPAEIATVQGWARTVFLRQAVAPELRVHRNNHESWAIFAGLVAAFTLHDPDLFATYRELLDAHIATAITPDGRLPLELERGDRAGWYTYFALAPILAGMQVVRNVTGEAMWDGHQARVPKALDHLFQTFTNPDRLGAGTSANPENLFEAAANVYPQHPWARDAYLAPQRPIEASKDQHIAWMFPSALPARR